MALRMKGVRPKGWTREEEEEFMNRNRRKMGAMGSALKGTAAGVMTGAK